MGRMLSFLILLVPSLQAWAGEEALWKRLKSEAGLVVLLRHTQPAGGNPFVWDESGNCAGEAMLTAAGQAHAKRIGDEFALRGINPTVISSPMCRCRDTAKIAFGGPIVSDGALREIVTADRERTKQFERKALSLISSRAGPTPVVFVSHGPNIDLLTMELIPYGDLLLGRMNDRGEIDVVGRIKVH